jgi:hypothetical protein
MPAGEYAGGNMKILIVDQSKNFKTILRRIEEKNVVCEMDFTDNITEAEKLLLKNSYVAVLYGGYIPLEKNGIPMLDGSIILSQKLCQFGVHGICISMMP